MGILKGKSGFMGRTRESLAELQEIGQATTRAGLGTLQRLTRTPVETRETRVLLIPLSRMEEALGAFAGSEVAARFPFTGSASGVAALFLSRGDALRLAELLLGSEQGSLKRLGDLEQSTIAETTNIALNGCLNALSGRDGVHFKPDVPESARGVKDIGAFLRPPGGEAHVVVVETPFTEPTRGVSGTMVLVIGVE